MLRPNAKDFAISKCKEIKEICTGMKYIDNKDIRLYALDKVYKLAQGIEEHLEYLDIITEEEED